MQFFQAYHFFQVQKQVKYHGQRVDLLAINLLKEEFMIILPDQSRLDGIKATELVAI